MELKQIEVQRLRDWGRKFFSAEGQDYQAFDFHSEIDRTLSVEENKTILRQKIMTFVSEYSQANIEKMKKKEAEIMPKEQHQNYIDSEIKRVEKQAELEFNKTLEKIENDKTTNIIEDIYYLPKQLCRMVIKGNAKGFLLIGERGIGKSHSVIRTFREEKTEFIYHTGHITSLELYQFLFENRDKHIVFDDVNIFNNKENLNLLKACLGDIGICSYKTSSSKLRVPNMFKFNGSITILLNSKPKDSEDLKAVESRILSYELKLDYKTKMLVIYELARIEYKELSEQDRQFIVSWIKEHTSSATENMSLRLLFQLYEFYRFDKANFERLGSKIIKNDEIRTLILSGVTRDEWVQKTGLSWQYYYKIKASLG